jgi:hypothetical protein
VLKGMTIYSVFLESMEFSKHHEKETLPNKQGCFNVLLWVMLYFTVEGKV